MLGDLTFFQGFLKIRLGQMLARRRQQIIAGYRLIDCGQKQRAKKWRLRPPTSAGKSESIKLSPTEKTPTEFSGQRTQQHSPDSLQPSLTSPQPSPAGGLGPGESTSRHSPSDSPHSLNQVQHSLPSGGTMLAAEFHLLENEEDLARRLDAYVKAEVLALDIETTGLDPLTDRIRLVQITAQDLPVVLVDLFKCGHRLSTLIPFLVNESAKIIHNAKFDLKFLFKQEVEIRGQIFDTMLTEQLLHAGVRGHSSTLASLVQSYL